jgi:DNA-binding Lrp family transcriptional regulator
MDETDGAATGLTESQLSTTDRSDLDMAGRTAATLDPLDRRILETLRREGRISVRELATRLRISRAGAYARIERLHKSGVITGYGARIDPHRYGYAISAYVHVTLKQRSWRGFVERLASLPQVEHVALVSGEHDVVLLVRAADVAELRDVVLDRLQAMPEVEGTRTTFILDEVITAGVEAEDVG